MHLLAETAISDSINFEVLSFDEVEQLKKERLYLKGKVETTRRKLALESKVRDAAQSLNRLYSTKESPDNGQGSPKRTRRSLLGSKRGENDALHRADDEYAASMKRVEELSRELFQLEKRLEHTEKRILMHTAGILQMTHRGLKKNVRRNELPRSPESMTSQPNGRGSVDFDERSLYQVPDYVTDFGHGPPSLSKSQTDRPDRQAIDNVASQLQDLNQRLHLMITQASVQGHFDPPPQPNDEHIIGRVDAQIQAYLGYMSQGLDAMEAAQARYSGAMQQSIYDTEEQLEDVNVRLHDMLQRTNSVGHSPVLPQDEPRGKDLQSQLAFSTSVLERLNKRIDTLIEQKDILTRQIQQQRELNTKSDAERDARIHELMSELEEAKNLQAIDEKEAQHSRDQINLLMEQLDMAKQQNVLMEQERGAGDGKAVELERTARKEQETKFLADLQTRQEEHSRLQDEMQRMRTEHGTVTTDLRKQIDELSGAKTTAENELAKHRQEMTELESEVVRAQTELTMVKAELDGAYGTRAQRAADVSMNPAVQKELDVLNARNAELEGQLGLLKKEREDKDVDSVQLQNKVTALQRELKETIEEYEVMTKQSIEDEKERERLEENVDAVQRRCEELENQLNEERVKSLGSRVSSPTETTSTMVLRNEFRKMMRDTRAENIKVLKVRLSFGCPRRHANA
jgi:chromosome segregation ATPase